MFNDITIQIRYVVYCLSEIIIVIITPISIYLYS